MKLVSQSENASDWFFKVKTFFFNNKLLMPESKQVSFSLALPGIGLPESEFVKFSGMIEKIHPKILCV